MLVLMVLTLAMVSMVGIAAFSQGNDIAQEVAKECYIPGDMDKDGEFNNRDAIYILYNSFFGDEDYPLAQDGDIDANGTIDNKDAIDLLYESVLASDSKYGKVTHDYYDPAWVWTETENGATVALTLKCACGQEHAPEVRVTAGQATEPSCTNVGAVAYTATVKGLDFTSSYTKILPATGHGEGVIRENGDRHYTACSICQAELDVPHNWTAAGEPTVGTCRVPGTQAYVCNCGREKVETLGYGEHAFVYQEDILKDADTCLYVKLYACSHDGCDETMEDGQYNNHTYVTVITKEATCNETGTKVSRCEDCAHVRSEEEIPLNSSHSWDDGVEANGVRTHTCNLCGETKKTTVAGSNGVINNDALQNADEVVVGDATVSMDSDVKDNLNADKEVIITVEKLDKEDILIDGQLTQDQKDQIGDNLVYDFNMEYTDGEKVDFSGGMITVSLPYELAEGEDIDSIDVWYIADDGSLELVKATYSNGYITFQTNHFSYYTVTRLTPAERCARYGHIWTSSSKTSTCTEDGYTKDVCQRCAVAEQNAVVIPATGHTYKQLSAKDATCDTFGVITYQCEGCKHEKTEILPSLGHDLEEVIVEAATCGKYGKKEHQCRNCDYVREEKIPQLSHDYQHDASQDKQADCTNGGYEVHVCKHCGDVKQKNHTPAKGHKHGQNKEWVWDDYKQKPVLRLGCEHEGCKFYKELSPNVEYSEATCENDGSAVAYVFYNGEKYEMQKTGENKKGHAWSNKWIVNETGHYRKCERCQKTEDLVKHDFDSGKEAQKPTCSLNGKKVYTCKDCNFTKEEVIPATGEHEFDKGQVTVQPGCLTNGLKVYTCKNCNTQKEEVLPAIGQHSFDDGNVTVQPGCLTNGLKVYTCTACGEQKKEVLPAIGQHSFDDGNVTVQPGCLTDGLKVYTCAACGEQKEEILPAIGQHNFDDGNVTVQPGCLTDGLKVYTCTACGEQKEEILPAVGQHSFDDGQVTVEPNCVNMGREVYTCTVCGEQKEMILAMTKCQDLVHVPAVEPTETEDGNIAHWFCQVCERYFLDAQGEECVDRTDVIIPATNPDCTHEYTIYEEGKLSDVTACGGWYTFESCQCGWNTWMQGDTFCNLVEVETNGTITIYECVDCGGRQQWEKKLGYETVCETIYHYKVTYLNVTIHDQLLTRSWGEGYGPGHKYVASFELFDGVSCEGGYRVTFNCVVCGQEAWSDVDGDAGHKTYEIARRSIEGACGQTELITAVCACGAKNETYLEGNYCEFLAPDEHDEGYELYRCRNGCGMIEIVTERKEEINACEWIEIVSYERQFQGEILCVREERWQSGRHEWTLDNYYLLGETCEDGAVFCHTCYNCGSVKEDIHYYHHTELLVWYEDLTLLGACAWWYERHACACGEYGWENFDVYCDWYEVEVGDDYTIYQCHKCDATMRENRTDDGSDACHLRQRIERIFESVVIDGKALVEYSERYEEMHQWCYTYELMGESCEDGVRFVEYCANCEARREHEVWYHEEIHTYYDLSGIGLCGGWVEIHMCPCGQSSWCWRVEVCRWTLVDDSGMFAIYECESCGAQKQERAVEVESNPCLTIQNYTVIYTGTETLKLDWNERDEKLHKIVTTFELYDGMSCEGGFLAIETCILCGRQTTTAGDWHYVFAINRQPIAGMCGQMELVTYSCACGQETFTETESWGSTCWFREEYWDADKKAWASECYYGCGTIRYRYDEIVRIEDSCEFQINNIEEFVNGGEVVLKRVNVWYETRHDWQYEFTLFGESCEDGVERVDTCTNCQDQVRRVMYWHEMAEQRYSLAEFGGCENSWYVVAACPCGWDAHAFFDGACHWEEAYHDELGWVYQCTSCDLYVRQVEVGKEVIRGCRTSTLWRAEFYNETGFVGSIDWRENYDAHRYYYELTLMDGAEDCKDGVWVRELCVGCDWVSVWETYGHNWYTTHREILNENDFCGVVEALTNGCACGRNKEVQILFDGCVFEWTYDEATGKEYLKCTACGAVREESQVKTPVEGFACQTQVQDVYTYTRDGKVLLTYTSNPWIEYNHISVYTYELLGETCADGYYRFQVCQECGEIIREYGSIYYNCNSWLVRKELIISGEDICTKVYLQYYSCACGAETRVNRSTSGGCNWNWQYDEAMGMNVRRCETCGLYYTEEYYNERVPGETCLYQYGYIYTYYRNDELLGVIQTMQQDIRHDTRCQMELLGETCADGYTRTWICADCGVVTEVDETIYTECSQEMIRRETILDDDRFCAKVYQYYYSCACGQNTHMSFGSEGDCNWVWQYDEALGGYIHLCETCGLYYIFNSETWTHVDGQPECVRLYTWGRSYYYDGQLLCDPINTDIRYDHLEDYSFTLNGETCDDGYYCTSTCMYCGELLMQDSEPRYGCETYLVDRQLMLSDDRFCSKVYQYYYSCACGRQQSTDVAWDDNCHWGEQYVEALDRWANVCAKCGLCRYSEYSVANAEGQPECVRQRTWTYYHYYDGQLLCEVMSTSTIREHLEIYNFSLIGETCDDGYYLGASCFHCGEVLWQEVDLRYGCKDTYLVEHQLVLSDDVICGAVYSNIYRCACGKNTRKVRQQSIDCQYVWQYVDAVGREIEVCTVCGVGVTGVTRRIPLNGSPACQFRNLYIYTYYLDDQMIASVLHHNTNVHTQHNWQFTFTMYGETCEDGYMVHATCISCGEYMENVSENYYCETYATELYAITGMNSSFCGDVWVWATSCPCGQQKGWQIDSHCEFFHSGTNEATGEHTYRCEYCGITYTLLETATYYPESCIEQTNVSLRFSHHLYDQLGSVDLIIQRIKHTSQRHLILEGQTCEDGFMVEYRCKYCDVLLGSDEEVHYRHVNYALDRYELKEYGMCGGIIGFYGCACGESAYWNGYNSCAWEWIDQYNEYGIRGRYCADCDTTIYMGECNEHLVKECRIVRTHILQILRNDTLLLEVVKENISTSHTLLMLSADKLDENRALVFFQCAYCDYQEIREMEGHCHYTTKILDLEAVGVCQGTCLEQYGCTLCDETGISYRSNCAFREIRSESKKINGVQHWYYTYQCDACGLQIQRETYEIYDQENCKTNAVNQLQVYMSDVLIGEVRNDRIYSRHTMKEVGTSLMEGATSCEQGVWRHMMCQYCDYTENWSRHYHEVTKQEAAIDLSQYGSVCGSYLEYYACVCGKYQEYRLSDRECDWDSEYTSCWIEGAIYAGQEHIDGWCGLYSEGHIYTCAVTNPRCGVKLRMSRYWLTENCQAVEYQVWQLGVTTTYDEATDTWNYTWEREIVIPTGNTATWHDYQDTSVTEELADGRHYEAYIRTCADCGSSFTEENWYRDGHHVKGQTTVINTLNDGTSKQRVHGSESLFLHNGSYYQTYYRDAYIHADGSEYWWQVEYAYQLEGECKRICTETNSYGGVYVSEEYHALTWGHYEILKENTCSQPGRGAWIYECEFCGLETQRNEHELDPHTHSWHWDDSIQQYRCGFCGLENINGADGTIVVEDLTAKYGNATNYVVGYWNRGDGVFTVYASVILDDATTEDNEIVLIGIDFTYLNDDICAVSADMSAVQAAAAAALAEAGYTGSYAIRITFVPADDSGMLDYAITFDSQMA